MIIDHKLDFTKDFNVGSLSNDNESAKKTVGQGSVYMEVGDPIHVVR